MFARLKEKGECAYVPYVCAGDPSVGFSVELAKALFAGGADMIELGVPFSDPTADGPVIQEAMLRSLANGFKTEKLFEIMASLRKGGHAQPIVVMTYFNPVLQYGIEDFLKKMTSNRGDGLLIVDLPPEESSEIEGIARANKVDIIRLAAPSTSDGRLKTILPGATGFVYAVAVAGTTGARSELAGGALDLVGRVRKASNLPVALGFGISQPEHVAAAVAAGASAVVEGSKIVTLYSQSPGEAGLKAVREHVRVMKSAAKIAKI